MCFSLHRNVLIIFYSDTTHREQKKNTNIDYLRRTGHLQFSKECCNASTEPCVRGDLTVKVLEFTLAFLKPLLNLFSCVNGGFAISGNNASKGCTWSCKKRFILLGVTPLCNRSNAWHERATDPPCWSTCRERVKTTYHTILLFPVFCGARVYMPLRVNLGCRPTVSDFQMAVQL